MNEQRLQPWALEKLVADENAERRSRSGEHSVVALHPFGVRGGLLYFLEYGPAMPVLPLGTMEHPRLTAWREAKGPDLARLEGDFVPAPPAGEQGAGPLGRHSRFVSGHLSIKAVDATALTIREGASGAVEVVIRDV